ncbi:TPA: helix-turn-helix transcriptional regulator [Candidatus Galligastranaerophilus intestinavium]|uniref:Helix-turn-helix transcriptional regulator n=1 Tax=Candidatus Galligastranaerophilus intestinavium TaxID=2840836 RepID=A0A9D1FIK7_9BACT|nr:helix-turn-helix transcriptional regulator [Candidatus Galligastranaerophilus intestinavium]
MKVKRLLGRKIKQYRVLKGFTQEELAEKLNISQRTLSGIECGTNFLSSNTLEKILEVFDISLEEMFYFNYLKSNKEIVNELINDIKAYADDTQKLQTIYKVVKAIIRD